MPLIFNGKSPIRIKYNGNEVRKVNYKIPGYTELEYIESSTGGEYIDLGVKGTVNTKVDIKFQATDTGFIPFGARQGANARAFAIWSLNTEVGTALRIGFDDTNGYTGPNTTNDKYDITLSKEGAFVNGIEVWAPDNYSSFETPGTLIVFGYRTAYARTLCMMKLFALKLWENNVLIQNLIPARRDSDNVLGMYDTVSDTFFTNNGTGAFTAGPESVSGGITVWRLIPEEYTEVEWIQSDGACYIDTNRTPNMNDIIEQKFMSLNTTTNTCSWYGSMPGSTALVPRICMGISGVGFFAAVNNTVGYGSLDNEIHTIKWQQNTATTLYIDYDGTETISPSGSGYDPVVVLTSYLFARHGNNGVQVYDGVGTRIYYHKEYLSNGTIQLDLVPVIRNSDNEPGMYDLVNKVFYTNGGSGSFIAGPTIG